MARICSKCGAVLADGDRFCARCGTPASANRAGTVRQNTGGAQNRANPGTGVRQPMTQNIRQTARQNARQNAAPTFEESVRSTVGPSVGPTVRSAPAASAPLYAFGPSGWIKGTGAVLFGQLGSMIAGVFKIFTKFKALLFTAAISALWIWLNHLRLFEGLDGIFAVLAKLTYSRGGTGGTVLEIIGGSLGKGIVGAALCSILYGGIGKMIRGIGNIFREPGFNIGAALLGFGIAAATYQFTAGFAGTDGFMVGVAGAMLSLEALSVREGFLVNLAASFSAQKVKTGQTTGRRLLPGRYKGFLTGAAIGFVVWMFLCLSETVGDIADEAWGFVWDTVSLDVPEGFTPYLIPFALILVGMILNAIGKGWGKEGGR